MARVSKEPQERRQEILDTAMRLFYEKGYERTSIADIAGAMNVAQGLCYRYFPSKEALFDTAIDQYAETLVARMTALLPDTGDPAEIARQLPQLLTVEAADDAAYSLCHQPENRKMHDALALAVCAKAQPVVKRLLSAAYEQATAADVETAASFIVYGQLGVLLREDLSLAEKSERISDFLAQALRSLS